MLTNLTYSLFIASLLFTLNISRTDSQNNPEVKSPEKPARVKSAQTELLPAPKKLSEHGVEFYDYRIDLPVKIVINLYDQSRAMVATAELSEDTAEKIYLYKIRPAGGDEAWVKVAAQTLDTGNLYSLASSEGGTVKVKFEKRAEKDLRATPQNAVRFKAVKVNEGGGWVNLRPDDFKKQKQHLLMNVERRKIFTTDALSLLRSVLTEYRTLESKALGALVGNTGQASSLMKKASWGWGTKAAECKVLCVRLATLVPMFACDDGSWLSEKPGCCPQAQGAWLIANCGIQITCRLPCEDFSEYDKPAEEDKNEGFETILP